MTRCNFFESFFLRITGREAFFPIKKLTSVNLNKTYIWHLRIWSWFPFDRQVRLVQLRRFCKWFRKQFHSKCCKFQDLQHHHCKFSPMDCGKLSPFHWKAEDKKKISDHLLLMDLRKKVLILVHYQNHTNINCWLVKFFCDDFKSLKKSLLPTTSSHCWKI